MSTLLVDVGNTRIKWGVLRSGRIAELGEEFSKLARSGDTVYGFVGAVYATDLPSLPEPS